MVTTRRAGPDEFDRVVAYYRQFNYTPTVHRSDVFVVAEHEGELCGVLRLCEEHDLFLLRGMRVSEPLRRRGIGTSLLKEAETLIGPRDCYCIPLRRLASFYGRIGFVPLPAAKAPPVLRQRCNGYRRQYALDVIIMHRPASAATATSTVAKEVEGERGE
jgi:N-acetylglutamate synthase-like GNAT family acetyltransferase